MPTIRPRTDETPVSAPELRPLVALVLAVAVLIYLITRWRVPPFIGLLLASLTLAAVTGLEATEATEAFAEGLGGLLASTALVIAFGAILGALLASSGGAAVISRALSGLLGPTRLRWTMFLVGTVVGVGVWFTVGLVLLAPIAITLARVTRRDLVVPACAMLAGLSAMHGLAPPHPGPLAAIELIGADVGRTIVWSLVVGAAAAAVAGPIFFHHAPAAFRVRLTEAAIATSPAAAMLDAESEPEAGPPGGEDPNPDRPAAPSLAVAVGTLMLPVALMVVAAGRLPGEPVIAMLIGVLVAYWQLGLRRGKSLGDLAGLTDRSLFPVANVLLIVGAGAGFSRVLIASGVGQSIAALAEQLALPPLLFGWTLAVAVRVATGSATTAITTAAGLVSVLVAADPDIDRERMVLAMGAGSLALSHVNDGGFWFVKEYLGLTLEQTLRTWTVLETLLSLAALAILLLLDWLL